MTDLLVPAVNMAENYTENKDAIMTSRVRLLNNFKGSKGKLKKSLENFASEISALFGNVPDVDFEIDKPNDIVDILSGFITKQVRLLLEKDSKSALIFELQDQNRKLSEFLDKKIVEIEDGIGKELVELQNSEKQIQDELVTAKNEIEDWKQCCNDLGMTEFTSKNLKRTLEKLVKGESSDHRSSYAGFDVSKKSRLSGIKSWVKNKEVDKRLEEIAYILGLDSTHFDEIQDKINEITDENTNLKVELMDEEKKVSSYKFTLISIARLFAANGTNVNSLVADASKIISPVKICHDIVTKVAQLVEFDLNENTEFNEEFEELLMQTINEKLNEEDPSNSEIRLIRLLSEMNSILGADLNEVQNSEELVRQTRDLLKQKNEKLEQAIGTLDSIKREIDWDDSMDQDISEYLKQQLRGKKRRFSNVAVLHENSNEHHDSFLVKRYREEAEHIQLKFTEFIEELSLLLEFHYKENSDNFEQKCEQLEIFIAEFKKSHDEQLVKYENINKLLSLMYFTEDLEALETLLQESANIFSAEIGMPLNNFIEFQKSRATLFKDITNPLIELCFGEPHIIEKAKAILQSFEKELLPKSTVKLLEDLKFDNPKAKTITESERQLEIIKSKIRNYLTKSTEARIEYKTLGVDVFLDYCDVSLDAYDYDEADKQIITPQSMDDVSLRYTSISVGTEKVRTFDQEMQADSFDLYSQETQTEKEVFECKVIQTDHEISQMQNITSRHSSTNTDENYPFRNNWASKDFSSQISISDEQELEQHNHRKLSEPCITVPPIYSKHKCINNSDSNISVRHLIKENEEMKMTAPIIEINKNLLHKLALELNRNQDYIKKLEKELGK